MYFFYLVVNRVDVCTSNSGKIYKRRPCRWCSFLRGYVPVAGQSQRPQVGSPEHPPFLAWETGSGAWEKEKEVKRWVSFISFLKPSSTEQLGRGEGRCHGPLGLLSLGASSEVTLHLPVVPGSLPPSLSACGRAELPSRVLE